MYIFTKFQIEHWGPFRTQNGPYLFTLLGHALNIFENMSNNIFKPCSHIQLNTQNPNPIFKLTIYYTKYTNNAKILSKF